MRAIALVIALGLAASGCFGRPRPMVFPRHDVSGKTTVRAVAQGLASLGYVISKADAETGIVSTEWSQYEIPWGLYGMPMPVRDSVQVVIGDGRVSVLFQAQCDWQSAAQLNEGVLGHGNNYSPGWEVCKSNESQTNWQIDERYKQVVGLLKAR